MTIRVFKSNGWRTMSAMKVAVDDAGIVFKDVSGIQVYVGGDWKVVFPPPSPPPPPPPPGPPPPPPPSPPPTMSVVCSPSLVNGSGHTADVTTALVTAMITGGLGPYTYAWELASWASDGTPVPRAVSPTSAATTFIKEDMSENSYITATFKVNVVDSTGQLAIGECQASFYYFSLD